MSSPNSILEGREVELQPLAPETNPDAGDTEEAPPPAADEAPISQRQPKSKGPLIIAWILSLLTLAFFVLTLLYALHSSAVSHIAAFGGAPSRPTRVLRVLSEIVSLLMVATLAGILQIIQHMCVVHMVGNWLIGYLTLDSGVGLFGLLGALFGRGTVWIPARLWSFGRIWFLLMIPALSVLVMSNIETKLVFYPIESAAPINGYGIGFFNASLADFWAPISDLTFSITFNEFLSDSSHAVDISDTRSRVACEALTSTQYSQDCQLKYFFPGSVENVAPALLAQAAATTADAFLTRNQTALLFEFGAGTQQWEFDLSDECRIYGAGLAAWALCLKNDLSNTLQAQLVICPDTTAAELKCLIDTSWTSNLGWTTSVNVSYPQANVAYSQINGSILWHTLLDTQPVQININSSDLLHVYDVVFNASASNAITPIDVVLDVLGMGSNKPTTPFFIWWYFYRIRQLQLQNPGASTRAIAGLHSLLAIAIYYCQVKGFAELRSLGYNTTNSFAASVMSQLPFAEPDTTLVPATLRYALDVDSNTIIPYIALGGFTLLLCFVALAIATVVSLGRSTWSSPYSTLNFCIKYIVYDEENSVVDVKRFKDMNDLSDAKVRLR